MKFSQKQIDQCSPIFKNTKIKNIAKRFVIYKARDEGLALFRVSAVNRIEALLVNHMLDRKLPKEVVDWLDFWMNDPGTIGEMVRELLAAIKEETGRAVAIEN